RDRYVAAGADRDRMDGGAGAVAQSEGLGGVGKTPFLARLDKDEAAFATAQEFDGAQGIGEAGRGTGEKDQARLLIADRRRLRPRTAAVAQNAGERRAREQLGERWNDPAAKRNRGQDPRPDGGQQPLPAARRFVKP